MSIRPDLLLVNPGNRKEAYQGLATELAAIEPPIWAGLMATFVRQKGHEVLILDANAQELTFRETAEHIAEIKPLLTALVVYGHHPSASTQNMPAVRAICHETKFLAPELKLLLVGGHVAALPERSLREEEVDFVAGGEGLYTLMDLLELLKNRGEADLEKVRDLYFWRGEKILQGPPAPLVTDLEGDMPGMAWDLLPMERYRAHNWHCFDGLRRMPYAALYTTLGCPFYCSFCCIQAPFRNGEKASGYRANSYRLWSPQRIIAEIDLLVKMYGVKNIKFADELFVLKPDHVNTLCDLIIERGYDLNIWAYARVDTVRKEMVEKLKRAGVNWLAFGIEAASERVRDGSRKGYCHEKIFETIEVVREAGINVIGNYIFGLPEDDLSTMQETLDLAVTLNGEFGNFYCAMAYPGSELYNRALEEGWSLPESWSGYSQLSCDTHPLSTRYLTSAQVLEFRDKAFQVYHNGTAYLKRIEEKFGLETVEHIRDMASHRITRKLLAAGTPQAIAQ